MSAVESFKILGSMFGFVCFGFVSVPAGKLQSIPMIEPMFSNLLKNTEI